MELYLSTAPLESGAANLRHSIQGRVFLPNDPEYDDARRGWNLLVNQYPAVIVLPKTPEDVVAAVHFARENHLGIAVQGTGHGSVRPADDALLINNRDMTGVHIDPVNQTAHVEAGVQWGAVLTAAQDHGLAPLLGSSLTVGAVGFSLGGGYGWLGRKYGLSSDNVLAFEMVTADGRQLVASATENSDIFWGLRGGGGALGIVTGMTIRLFPVTQVYAGNLYYPVSMAKEVLSHYREWTKTAPEELTTSVLIMNFPPIPELPDPIRGQSFAMVRGCYAGPIDKGEELLNNWRNWQLPTIDDWKEISFRDAAGISMDPVDPTPTFLSGAWLTDLSDEVIDALERYATGKDDPTPLIFAEVRHAGGAVSRPSHEAAVFGNRDAELLMSFIATAPDLETHHHLVAKTSVLMAAIEPWLTGGVYMNFLEGVESQNRIRDGLATGGYERLSRLKGQVDPDNLLRYSFNILPTT